MGCPSHDRVIVKEPKGVGGSVNHGRTPNLRKEKRNPHRWGGEVPRGSQRGGWIGGKPEHAVNGGTGRQTT